MGSLHVRTPKNFVLEERLERYGSAIETSPESYIGHWREACAPAGSKPFARLHLDLGCGKGTYLAERAKIEPDTLFIGADQEPICIAYAAQRVVEAGIANAVLVPRKAGSLARIFATGELDAITLNFPTRAPRHAMPSKGSFTSMRSQASGHSPRRRRNRHVAHRQQTAPVHALGHRSRGLPGALDRR